MARSYDRPSGAASGAGPRDPDGVPADVAVRHRRELATTWEQTDGGLGRQMLAEALFERTHVLGAREATIRLTDGAVAHGFAAAIRDRIDVTVENGRGEGSQTSTTDLNVPIAWALRCRVTPRRHCSGVRKDRGSMYPDGVNAAARQGSASPRYPQPARASAMTIDR